MGNKKCQSNRSACERYSQVGGMDVAGSGPRHRRADFSSILGDRQRPSHRSNQYCLHGSHKHAPRECYTDRTFLCFPFTGDCRRQTPSATLAPSMDLPTTLSTRLAALLAGSFFRPLARQSASIYVDCADRLALNPDESGQLSQADTLALIRDVLAAHPRAELGEDEGAHLTDLRPRAAQSFNKLLEAGWLQERTVSLEERWVLLTPRVRPLVRLLRELAEGREKKRITLLGQHDLVYVCLLRTWLATNAAGKAVSNKEFDDLFVAHMNRAFELISSRMRSLADLQNLVPFASEPIARTP